MDCLLRGEREREKEGGRERVALVKAEINVLLLSFSVLPFVPAL
jgi:hypothetical protein